MLNVLGVKHRIYIFVGVNKKFAYLSASIMFDVSHKPLYIMNFHLTFQIVQTVQLIWMQLVH